MNATKIHLAFISAGLCVLGGFGMVSAAMAANPPERVGKESRDIAQKPGKSGAGRKDTLPAPGKIKVAARKFSLILEWKRVAGANRYRIETCNRKTSSGCSMVAEPSQAKYVDTSVVPDVTYSYRISACNAEGCGPQSKLISGKVSLPEAKGGLSVMNLPGGAPQVLWVDQGAQPLDGTRKKVRFFRCTSEAASSCSAPPFAEKPLNGAGASVNDANTKVGKRYHYAVRVCVKGACGALSHVASGVHLPAMPTRGSASKGTRSDGVEVTWSPVPAANRYMIYRYRRTQAPGARPVHATSATPSFLDTKDVQPGVQYRYSIRACLGTVCSAPTFLDYGYRAYRKEYYHFVVPVAVGNLHSDIQFITPLCRVFNNSVLSNANQVDRWRVDLPVPANRKFNRNVFIRLSGQNLTPGKQLDSATHYSCTLYVKKSRNGPLLSLSENNNDPALRVAPNAVTVVKGETGSRGRVDPHGEGLDIRTSALRANGQPES